MVNESGALDTKENKETTEKQTLGECKQLKKNERMMHSQEKKLERQFKKQQKLLQSEQNKRIALAKRMEKKEFKNDKKLEKQELVVQKKAKERETKNAKMLEKKKLNDEKKEQKQKSRFANRNVADWFKLDNAGIIYPSIKDENWSFVVRFFAVLNEEIDVSRLQIAVNETMKRFPTFNVGLKPGLFWNYFEEKSLPPIVEKEEKFPCSSFELYDPKSHIVRVLYYQNRISVECFHGIADGRSILKFFNSLLRRYFILGGMKIESTEGALEILDKPRKEEFEDAFNRYCTKGEKGKLKEAKAYHIKGTNEEFGVCNATMGTISVSKVKEVAKSYDCTLTEFLVSELAYAIYKKNIKHNKPIKMSVPIDLRQFFESETLRNFSAYINIELPPKVDGYILQDVIDLVKQAFTKITKENMQAFINNNVGMQKNFLIKIVPLRLKNVVIKLVYHAVGEAYQTMNVSNIGLVKTPEEFSEKIIKYGVNLGRPKYNAKTVGIISYNDNMVITISSKVKENDIEEEFFKSLATLGTPVLIESNRRDYYA